MTTLVLTAYVLIWPIIVAFVLVFLARGFIKDWRQSRKDGRPII